ncbi:hypothetical protein BJP44_04320 [Candidatus Williamhamiltonella defendens]|uniref:Uncharacterized protein n=1 Tax=Hamiltonella defensa subsp. Acyrthosiphon pisum (strain 5AT) TaxID=572265 RepID=C4K504_HAMD5|nr:hypothetical protein [Candidatus Hamiltonella defensa]ACQ67647.1 hypothetical protein HDEF_0941 [Candidatus Hamiltonella defensa 5AT (Acyrthosiphon pisum)]ATW22347.1 hypothetical protein BJP44_04320 [Candidatus Hamiltonella defensa]
MKKQDRGQEQKRRRRFIRAAFPPQKNPQRCRYLLLVILKKISALKRKITDSIQLTPTARRSKNRPF